MKPIYYCFLFSFILLSCGKKNISKTEEPSAGNFDLERAYATYQNQLIDYNTFSAKVKCKYEDEKKNLSFKTTVRIEKDKQIWLSASLFGIEGVRALVTPDSIKMINRLEREYYVESIEELKTLSGLPVDFNMLQQLLTGQILLINADNATLTEQESTYELISVLDKITASAWLDNKNLLLLKQAVEEQAENRKMEISYGNYESIGAAFFPFESDVLVSGEDNLSLALDFSDVEVNETLNFPFSISSSYKKAEL